VGVRFVGRLFVLGLAAFVASGCGGGGSGATPPTASGPVSAPQSGVGGATVGVANPGASASPGASPGATATPSTPNPNLGSGETPSMADAFVDSIGVNVHLAYYQSYYANFAQIRAMLTTLGVRHYRDGVTIGDGATTARIQTLAAAGIRADVLSTEGSDVGALGAYVASLGSAVDAVEGPNEFDLSNTPSWATLLDAFQSALYPSIHATGVTVIGPAVSEPASFALAGPFTTDADEGNMHDYFAGRNPGTSGWGATDAFGTYGSLPWHLAIAGQMTPGKPMVATETGYSDAADTYVVPSAIKAHYTVRTVLEHWNAHVARTYLYELVDEGNVPFSHYGLVDASGNPKPAYTALKNVIGHLTDAGPAFPVTALSYTLTGSVHHALFERRNGTYVLALWNEAQEWDVNAGALTPPAPVAVTLAFPAAPRALAATTLDDTGASATVTLPAQKSTALQITGMPTLVDVTP
jgi:hypothetical protein